MLILFDHGTPRGLARAFSGHTVITAQAKGWDRLNNGALLDAAKNAAVDLLLTTDQRIRYQQNLSGRKIAIVVLAGSTKWSRVRCILKQSFPRYIPRRRAPTPKLKLPLNNLRDYQTEEPQEFSALAEFAYHRPVRPETNLSASYSSGSGCRLRSRSPAAFLSAYFWIQASQFLPAAVSRPVKASAAMSEYAIVTFSLAFLG